MNALWHKQHPLARNASFAERIAWHREHHAQCGCRPIPSSLREHLKASRKLSTLAARISSASTGIKE
jgi:hypothetical protein